MKKSDMSCTTWRDVLINNGFNKEDANSLIGFISWNRGENYPRPGKDINNILSDHNGKVFSIDVVSSSYNDKGIIFSNQAMEESKANEMFDTIMKYEQEDVYKL